MTPDNTFGTSIDTAAGTWSLGPNSETMLSNHMGGGAGSQFCLSGDLIYVQGVGENTHWYVWRDGNHWELFGPNPPIPFPVPPPSTLKALTVDGAFFRAGAERFTIIECTDFQLFQRFLHKEDVSPVLRERAALGFNMLRILGTCSGMFRLFPQDWPNYYLSLRAFIDFCGTFGLYVEFTAFADATVVMPARNQQLQHWAHVGAALQGCPTVIVELGNELDQPINRLLVVQEVQPIPGIICSHGSNGSQARPVRPWWNYETIHYNDAYQWPRKVGHNSMEDGFDVSGVPALANENTRPDRDGNIKHFYDAAAGAALLCAGSCFHSQSGKASVLFNSQDRPFAEQWVAGARSISTACQVGDYKHRRDLEQHVNCAAATGGNCTCGERAYQRGDDGCIAHIRP